MNVQAKKNDTTQYVKERIVSDDIDQLLNRTISTKTEINPYALDCKLCNESPEFINGQKKPMEPATLKSAGKEPLRLKPASKETKPAYLTMEVNMLRMKDKGVKTMGIFATNDKYTKVIIIGLEGERYIATDKLRILVCRYLTEIKTKDSKEEVIFSVTAKIDAHVLAPYLYKIVREK